MKAACPRRELLVHLTFLAYDVKMMADFVVAVITACVISEWDGALCVVHNWVHNIRQMLCRTR